MALLAAHYSGSWVGDGEVTRVIETPFQPTAMFVQWATFQAVWRSATMDVGQAIDPSIGEPVADTITAFTAAGVEIGFQLNVLGETYYYQVFRDGVGFEHGSYVGDGSGLQRFVATDQIPEFIYVCKSVALSGAMQVWTTADGDFLIDAPRVVVTGAGGFPTYPRHRFEATFVGGSTLLRNYVRWQIRIPGTISGSTVEYSSPFLTSVFPSDIVGMFGESIIDEWGATFDASYSAGGYVVSVISAEPIYSTVAASGAIVPPFIIGFAYRTYTITYPDALQLGTMVGSGPFVVKDAVTGATIDPANYTVTPDTSLIGGEVVSEVGVSSFAWVGPIDEAPATALIYGFPATLEVTPYYQRPTYWTPTLTGERASRFMLGDLSATAAPYFRDFAQNANGVGIDAVVPGGFVVSPAQNSLNVVYHWIALRPQTAFASRISYGGAAGQRMWNVTKQFVVTTQGVTVSVLDGTFLSENVDFMILADTPSAGLMTLTNRGLWTTASDLVSSYADVSSVTTTDLSTTYTEDVEYTKVVTDGVTTLHKIGTMDATVAVHGTMGRTPLYAQVKVDLADSVTQDIHGFPFAPNAVWIVPGQRLRVPLASPI